MSLSLFITRRVSTFCLKSSKPFSAYSFLNPPSVQKGTVTTPTVNISFSLAIRAITGAAPVPVPPPIPAVINSILVLDSNNSVIRSMLSSAALRPTSGLAPAPNPSVKSSPI